MRFWKLAAQNIPHWLELERKEISKVELRERDIAAQAAVILALGLPLSEDEQHLEEKFLNTKR